MGKFKRSKFIDSVNIETLTGDKTLAILLDAEIQIFDPNGTDRNIILPAVNDSIGYSFKIVNNGTSGNLNIKNSNLVFIITIVPNFGRIFICDNNNWKNYSSSDHPTGDGNLHVPITSTINSGKALIAGATAGVFTWQTLAPGGVTSVTGTSPIVSSGGVTPAISIPVATNAINGYASSTHITAIEANSTHRAAVTGAEHGAVSANTANMIVRRDESGDFIAGTITAALTGSCSGSSGSCTGNAATTTKLITARNINGVSFDGTADITVYTHPTSDGSLHVPATGTSSSGKALIAGATAGAFSWVSLAPGGVTSVTGTSPIVSSGGVTPAISIPVATNAINGYASSTHITSLEASATHRAAVTGAEHGAVSTNTANMIVRRDASGDFTGRYINAGYLTSTDDTSSATISYIMAKFGDNYHRSAPAAKVATFISGQTMNISGSSTSCTGNAATSSSCSGNALTASSCTGNAATSSSCSGVAAGVTCYNNRTDAAWYQVAWRSPGDTNVYSTGNVTIQSSAYGGIGFNGSAWIIEGNASYGLYSNTGFYAAGGLWSATTIAAGTTVSAATITSTGNITAYYSDSRLKDFHGTIPNALNKVLSLNGYYFTENDIAKSLGCNNDRLQVGLSAQEVEKVLPEVITDSPIKNNQNYKTIWYEKIIPLLIEAIKEQQTQIEELKNDIASIRSN
jgi:hypothetical protein